MDRLGFHAKVPSLVFASVLGASMYLCAVESKPCSTAVQTIVGQGAATLGVGSGASWGTRAPRQAQRSQAVGCLPPHGALCGQPNWHDPQEM